MMVEIKTKCCGEVICSGDTLRNAFVDGFMDGVDFSDADLSDIPWGEIPLNIMYALRCGIGGRLPYVINGDAVEPVGAVVETVMFPEPVTVSTGETLKVRYTYNLEIEPRRGHLG